MRTLLKVSAIPVPTLFLSTAAVAQTGESAAAVPGEVVHRGYALQDEWQRLRNAAASSPPALRRNQSRRVRSCRKPQGDATIRLFGGSLEYC
jgi:hypothetical protein